MNTNIVKPLSEGSEKRCGRNPSPTRPKPDNPPKPQATSHVACNHEIQRLNSELTRLRAENERLKKGIETQANAVKMMEDAKTVELQRLRRGEDEARVARETLDSEREANAILTGENDRLRGVYAEMMEALTRIANICENFDGCPIGPQTIAEIARAALSRVEQTKLESEPKPKSETCRWTWGPPACGRLLKIRHC
ncbi:MAG TPA: hypothetical protein PKM25_05865 [Candidatus Ozemobacteraceae bacterium]|nr:hypothetical protein [Candidatus Ozemobacteraceae bacterium]